MTSGQRRAHKFIWLVLVITIPVFMITTISGLDFNPSDKNDIIKTETSNKNILKTAENELIKVNIYKDHIDMILKSPLKNASSVVYQMDNQGTKGLILGQLINVGIYKFNIKDIPKGILVYDTLKESEITKLTF